MTAPTAVPPTCSVWRNGVRMADGQPSELDTTPVVLTDLKVVWGRPNNLDQPPPGTCTFRMLDVPGGTRFLDAIGMGDRIDVRTDGTVYGAPTLPMLPASPLGNAYARNGIVTPATGWVAPVDGLSPVVVFIPPAALSSNPSAWNGIARAKPSQTWHASVAVTLQRDLSTTLQAVTLRPVAYYNPDGSDADLLPVIATTPPNTVGKVTLQADFMPPFDAWVGLAITLYPTGPAWADVPPVVTWTSLTATPAWADLNRILVDPAAVTLLAPSGGTQYAAAVFSGRVTDMTASYRLDKGGTVVDVIAQDHTAELANRYVGDTPWTQENLSARFAKVVAASKQTITYTVDTAPGALPVTARDVDAQPATRLLQELAISAAGVLWSATSLVTGPLLRLEDIGARSPLWTLVKGGDNIIRIVITPTPPAAAVTVSACSVLLEPVQWIRASDDDSTEVAVTWWDQSTTPPSSKFYSAVDANEETRTGKRRIGVSTQLSTLAAAQGTANAVLGRVRTPGWRVSGLVWDMGPEEPLNATDLATVFKLLDGTTRIGLPILLKDLPTWSPITGGATTALYLEGGQYESHDGYWTLQLLVSSAKAQGAAAIPWNALPAAWLWNQFDPTITWSDLAGVGV